MDFNAFFVFSQYTTQAFSCNLGKKCAFWRRLHFYKMTIKVYINAENDNVD